MIVINVVIYCNLLIGWLVVLLLISDL